MKTNDKNSGLQNTPQPQDKNANLSNYLVTQSIDPNSIDKEKINSDLSLLSEAEEKKEYKADISKGIENPQVKRAVSSLKLSNPFKGY
jgi:hypothetical protein